MTGIAFALVALTVVLFAVVGDSPQSPTTPEPSPWEEDEGAMKAEDVYLAWLDGPADHDQDGRP